MRRKVLFLFFMLLMIFSLLGCSNAKNEISIEQAPDIEANRTITEDYDVEDAIKSGTADSNYVELTNLKDNIWVHTTYEDYNGKRTSSNGLVIETSGGLVLIDTPWNNEQTNELITLTKSKFNKDFSLAIITHSHEDRIGGIDKLLKNNIDVRSTILTAQMTIEAGYKKPTPSLDSEPSIKVGDVSIEVLYPGEGHSTDNIVVWFPQNKVLFGGCIIKALDSRSLGNLADANIEQWPASIKKILEKYPDAHTVIPGHGNWGGMELIRHTLELLEQ